MPEETLEGTFTALGNSIRAKSLPNELEDQGAPKFMKTSAEVNRQKIGPDNLLRLSRDWRLAVSPGTRTSMGIAIRVGQNPIIRVK